MINATRACLVSCVVMQQMCAYKSCLCAPNCNLTTYIAMDGQRESFAFIYG